MSEQTASEPQEQQERSGPPDDPETQAGAAQEPLAPPPFPRWRDHFEAAIIWPAGREHAPRTHERIPLDPVHPHERHAAAQRPQAAESVGDAVGEAVAAAADRAARLAREVAEMSEEERAARMQRLAAGMRPISSDAEQIVVRALDFGATGLARLAERIERRSRAASGLPPARRRRQ